MLPKKELHGSVEEALKGPSSDSPLRRNSLTPQRHGKAVAKKRYPEQKDATSRKTSRLWGPPGLL